MFEKIGEFIALKIFMPCAFAAGLILIAILLYLPFDKTEENLMKECMRDGKKHYECVSMLRQNYRGYR